MTESGPSTAPAGPAAPTADGPVPTAEAAAPAARRGPVWPTAVAVAALTVAVIGGLAGVAMAARAAATPGGYPQDPLTALSTMAAILSYGSVGLILRIRRPDNSIGWLFLGIALTAAGSNLGWGFMSLQSEQATTSQTWLLTALIASAVLLVAWFLLIISIILCFPDGRPAGRPERRLLLAAVAGTPILVIGLFLRPGPMIGLPAFENPLLPAGGPGAFAFPVAFLWQFAIAALAVGAMAARYRAGARDLRHQIRWFALGAAVIVAAGCLFIVTGLVVPTSEIAIWNIVFLVFSSSLVVLPVAVLFAITRHRLYEIDRIISRAFVFGALTAILAGLLAASMRVLEALFVAVTGEDSDLVVVLSALVLTIAFTPLKSRLEKLTKTWFVGEADAIDHDGAQPLGTGLGDPELDARIEAIARRVSEEVVANAEARRSR